MAARHATTPQPTLPATGFVRQAALLPLLSFSATTLWRRVKQGTFPKPVKLSPMVTAWRVEEVRAWIDAQSASHLVG